MVRKWRHFPCVVVLVFVLTSEIYPQQNADRFQVGGHFGLLFNHDKVAGKKSVLPEFGGAFTYLLSKHFAIEAESSFYPRNGFLRPFPGDLIMRQDILKANYSAPACVGLFGGRAGIRIGKVAIFAKARPGFAVFHPVYDCQSAATDLSQCHEVRRREFAMDIGAVVEANFWRHAFVRFDAGDTYLRFGKTSILFRGSGLPWVNYSFGPDHRHQFHLKMGIGVGF